jgi:tetratricopeptide (TPR) repeat protein
MTRQIRLLRYTAVACAVFVTLAGLLQAQEGGPGAKPSGGLWGWEQALREFQKAGTLIGSGKYSEAKTLLNDCAKTFLPPYCDIAAECRDNIDNALREGHTLAGYYRFGALGETCLRLHAHREAAKFSLQATKAFPEDHHGHGRRIAWCLVESGAREEGLLEYRERLAKATAPDWREYYETQVQLVTERPQRMNDLQFATDYIRKHYLKGYDVETDYLGALMELKRVMPDAKSETERLSMCRLFIECLSGLHDDAGRFAWEQRVLEDFKADADTCASIYLSRGQRAYEGKKLDEALLNYLRASTDYPNSRSYGIAQYNVSIVLKDQGKYDEAIAEFAELFPSAVSDRDPGGNIMEAYRNYRHRAALRISECYEAKRDFVRALQFATLARDKYRYQSWCGTCSDSASRALAKRIEDLEHLANGSK